jgi:hypothetical protein
MLIMSNFVKDILSLSIRSRGDRRPSPAPCAREFGAGGNPR